ncbi:MAG: tetratricopeptide repeat-containing protein [Burkholderiales bacterium]
MTTPESPAAKDAKRCFIVMGFGMKTDYATGRKLDLDKSYRLLVKPVVEEKGLVCVRADEIRHSGAIDVPMYRELLTADVVIADLSTANPNALYELGIRHALRPRTTVVISENKLPYPFDLNHIVITSYTHLGDAIDFDEVMRFRKLLGETLDAVLRKEDTDSPVYTFMQGLTPPAFGRETVQAIRDAGAAVARAGQAIAAEAAATTAAPGGDNKTLATIIEQGEDALRNGRFPQAKALFGLALDLCKKSCGLQLSVRDAYLLHRLVLATYKSKEPDELTALKKALDLLSELDLESSNDPETVGLAGAVEKRLFDKGEGVDHLARAIFYYGRGYYLRNDRYNGINLAYLLNVRTDTALDANDHERIADLVWANRLRREVLSLCEKELAEIGEREQRSQGAEGEMVADQRAWELGEKFWCLATKAEAHFGLGETAAYEQARAAAHALPVADWMRASLDEQVERLKRLLDKHGHLLQ